MSERLKIALKGGQRDIRFAMTPEVIEVQCGPRRTSLDLMLKGVEIRNGPEPTVYSWSGLLPGRSRRRKPFVFEERWEAPERVDGILVDWSRSGRELRLVVTGTGIVDDVFVGSYRSRRAGGHGDIAYDIELVEHREVDVEKGPKKKRKRKKGRKDNDGHGDGGEGGKGRDGGKRRTYTVKPGDSLWKIAKAELGDGGRWREIYEIPDNRKKIGPNPDDIKPGMVLAIPRR